MKRGSVTVVTIMTHVYHTCQDYHPIQVEACAEGRRDGGAQDFETSKILPGGAAHKGSWNGLQGVFARLRPPARPCGGSVAGPVEGLAGGTSALWVTSRVSGAARVVYTPTRNPSGAKLPPGVDIDTGRGHCRGTPRAGSDLHPTSRRPHEGPAGALLQGSRSWVRTPSHSLLDRSP